MTPLSIRELSPSPTDRSLFEWLLHRYHYLIYSSSVGLNLKHLAEDRPGPRLSCLLFGSAAWQCAVLEGLVGWTAATRQTRLQEIPPNTEFLSMPGFKFRISRVRFGARS